MDDAAVPDEYAEAIRELETLRQMLAASREGGEPLDREATEAIRLRVLALLTSRLATLVIEDAKRDE